MLPLQIRESRTKSLFKYFDKAKWGPVKAVVVKAGKGFQIIFLRFAEVIFKKSKRKYVYPKTIIALRTIGLENFGQCCVLQYFKFDII